MSPRPSLGQLVTWVYTEDLDLTCRFYGELLELPLVVDQGAARIFRAAGDAFVGVCRVYEGRTVAPEGSMISLVTDDVDLWYERLTAAGVPTRGAPKALETYGIYCFFAADPNGYTLEFQRFLDPNWNRPTTERA